MTELLVDGGVTFSLDKVYYLVLIHIKATGSV